MYLSRGKASRTGQFFTPQSVSDLVAMIGTQKAEDHGTVHDCAAGSGRLLLAHYMEKSKFDHKTYWLECVQYSKQICAN